jgi:hypothetical protein
MVVRHMPQRHAVNGFMRGARRHLMIRAWMPEFRFCLVSLSRSAVDNCGMAVLVC